MKNYVDNSRCFLGICDILHAKNKRLSNHMKLIKLTCKL